MSLISVVCHENIARSQVLGHYLNIYINQENLGSEIQIFSCGTTMEPNKYGDEEFRLSEVQNRLDQINLNVKVERNWWDSFSEEKVRNSDIIIVADSMRKKDVVDLLGEEFKSKTYLFYEIAGEGSSDFTDTYDPSKGKQDPERFDRCFNELNRLAKKIIPIVKRKLNISI